MNLSKLQLKKLLCWTTKGTVFQFQEDLYERTDGVAMGSLIARLIIGGRLYELNI